MGIPSVVWIETTCISGITSSVLILMVSLIVLIVSLQSIERPPMYWWYPHTSLKVLFSKVLYTIQSITETFLRVFLVKTKEEFLPREISMKLDFVNTFLVAILKNIKRFRCVRKLESYTRFLSIHIFIVMIAFYPRRPEECKHTCHQSCRIESTAWADIHSSCLRAHRGLWSTHREIGQSLHLRT